MPLKYAAALIHLKWSLAWVGICKPKSNALLTARADSPYCIALSGIRIQMCSEIRIEMWMPSCNESCVNTFFFKCDKNWTGAKVWEQPSEMEILIPSHLKVPLWKFPSLNGRNPTHLYQRLTSEWSMQLCYMRTICPSFRSIYRLSNREDLTRNVI